MIARTPVRQLPLIAALVLVLVLVPAALAGKGGGGAAGGSGGGGKKPPSGPTYSGTVSGPFLVTDKNGNGSLNYGDTITFKATSNAPYYYVKADCYQGGTLVWEDTEGFFTGWVWGQNYALGGAVWKSGAANCTAVLFSQNANGTNVQTLAPALSFNVGA